MFQNCFCCYTKVGIVTNKPFMFSELVHFDIFNTYVNKLKKAACTKI